MCQVQIIMSICRYWNVTHKQQSGGSRYYELNESSVDLVKEQVVVILGKDL